MLIHIADAPCHGTKYHNLLQGDSYPYGDPGGLQLDNLMKQLAEKEISYYFGYIKRDDTTKMIKAFDASLQMQSNKIYSIKQFDVSNPTSLLEGVFRSVTCSITATREILISGNRRCPQVYTIDESTPEWNSLNLQQVMVTPPPPIGSGIKPELPHQPINVKIAPQPFAVGSQKIVYHAYDEDNKEHIVQKRSKWTDPKSNSIKRCLETANVHAISAIYAATFNQKRPSQASEIQFVPVGIMGVKDSAKGTDPKYYTYEPYMDLSSSDYTKFNSNMFYIHTTREQDNPIYNDTCQAFSHFTWVKSGRTLVICDLQGVKSGSRLILTDPAIHHINILRYGSTNLGVRGIQMFFRVHKCNNICRALKLDKELPEQPSGASPTTPAVAIMPALSATPTITAV